MQVQRVLAQRPVSLHHGCNPLVRDGHVPLRARSLPRDPHPLQPSPQRELFMDIAKRMTHHVPDERPSAMQAVEELLRAPGPPASAPGPPPPAPGPPAPAPGPKPFKCFAEGARGHAAAPATAVHHSGRDFREQNVSASQCFHMPSVDKGKSSRLPWMTIPP